MQTSLEQIKKTAAHLSNDPDPTVRSLARSHPLREPLLCEVIPALALPGESSGLDIGCGIGLPALIIAGLTGSGVRITGVDLSEACIDAAQRLAHQTGLSGRLRFETGNASALAFDDDRFDWAVSVDCVNYAPVEPLPQLKEMKRVIKKGGKIALLGWTSQQLLPGYPELEAKLNATSEGIAPFQEGTKPENHFLRTPTLLEALFLKNTKAHTFIGNVCAPLTPDIYEALKDLLTMRWAQSPSGLSATELALYKDLTHPDSPAFILDTPGYHGFFTCTLFTADV